MAEHKIPFLCGGIFFFLISGIKQGVSAREHAKGIKDEVKNEDIMDDLVYAVTGRRYTLIKSEVSLYRSCRSNGTTGIPFDDKHVRDAFSDAFFHDYATPHKRMTEFLDKYMVGSQQMTWFVKQLLDIIFHDESIKEEDYFYILANGEKKTKSEIREMRQFDYQPFVLGVVYFIISQRYGRNKEGDATFDAWKKKDGNTYKYDGDAGLGITYKIEVKDCRPCEEPINEQEPESVPAVNETASSEEDTRTDDEVIFDNLRRPLEMFANVLEAQKHQLAEQIRANNKKSDPPEDESDKVYSAFKQDSFEILRYCIDTDISAEPVKITLADEINALLEKWQYDARKISNQEQAQIVAETLKALSEFEGYLSEKYMRYNSNCEALIFRNGSAEEGERLRNELHPESLRIRKALAALFKRMWPDPNFDEPETIEAEVVDDEMPSGAAEDAKTVVIQNQTNIGKQEINNFDLNNAHDITFNL